MGLEYLSGCDPGNGFLLPADCSRVATLCGRLGVGNRASAETPKDLGGGDGEEQNGHFQVGAFSPAGGLGG